MILSTLRMAAAAAVLAVTAGAAGATAILSPVPNPIPEGSTWDLVGTFDTPFGWVRVTTVSDFKFLSSSSTAAGTDLTYSANLSQIGYSEQTGGVALGAEFSFDRRFRSLHRRRLQSLFELSRHVPGDICVGDIHRRRRRKYCGGRVGPLPTSLGSVTISAAPGGGFFIDNRAAIFGVYTINGGDPITVPVALTVGAPEPSTWTMMALGFAGLGFAGYRASRKTAAVAA